MARSPAPNPSLNGKGRTTESVYTLTPQLGVRPPAESSNFPCVEMANERTTETLVRDYLREHGVEGQLLEEQTSSSVAVKRALAAASKAGDGVGKPGVLLR